MDTPGTAPQPPRWAQELEDGPLRRELGVPADAPAAPAAPATHVQHLSFSGSGSEYFRIWVVNLLLTLATLGLYSAWAKVRKARWFAQHTALAGDRFDFHGRPWRILSGRVVAVALLLLWTWGFEFSLWLGLTVLALFCVAGPLLFASAQRFKLANTSWRGLRFGFEVPRRDVYLTCVPLLLLWTAGSVAQAAGVEGGWFVAATLLPLAGLPWAHARLKRLQHRYARFGTRRFSMEPRAADFYGLYAKGLALVVVGGALGGVLASVAMGVWTRGFQSPADAEGSVLPWVLGLLVVLLGWMMAWPYFAARLQQIVWGATSWGGDADATAPAGSSGSHNTVRFGGTMRGRTLWRLVLANGALVLLTCGLYWPFAAVAVARYRVQSITVESDAPLAQVRAHAPPADEQRSVGDGAADFFGLDLGW